MNLLSEEDQRQNIEGERQLMNDPKYFSPTLALLGATKSGLPAFGILIFPYGDRQIRPPSGRDEEPAYLILPHNAEAE
jgi:hypothetical protein